MRQRRRGRGQGQAILGVILVVTLAGMAWEGLNLAWAGTTGRLALQSGLEAGATTGAAILADGLNTVAITNVALLALGLSALLGNGEAAALARQLQRLQDAVIKQTPGLAKHTAWVTAMASGVHLAQPAKAGGSGWPHLMLRRVYFVPLLFGERYPLWIADDLHQVEGRRWGNRVIFLEGWRAVRWGPVALPLHYRVGAAAAKAGGGGGGWFFASSAYDSRLVPWPGKAGGR